MSLQDVLISDLEIAFDDWGKSASYVSGGGDPATITAIMTYGEDLEDAQWRAALQASATALVRESDVSDPANNDTLTVDGVVWTVTGRRPSESGYWKLALRRDLRPTYRK